ncbi:pimeloyl-ACP methyl ester carboxylesterase [Paenibacillus cellulosilyticus]|uniref:Pimeloyl-ACP methyl ester carboxylesterase n=1 Tax=Paenibacillus cellulosilyticus TaxID=375489 RepID=A0A2V2YXJ2_9BACL|nr:alpha/beta hydrolase [Paenibacillus cellulosilyticus]PWW02880.1 pimeloyl-ACP methyl ester carboxylesterase [Paenibacillus cellulosilyticus]QKS45793.1 alpha/beta hydrolase [Paenibacillus cellulosilyticus]
MNPSLPVNTSKPVPIGRTYEVQGRQLLLHSEGSGGPAVVMLPGAGFVGLDYWNIQKELARYTTCVIYDRAGTGWSDSVKLPRSAGEVIDELRQLLHVSGIQAPYLLVGHSLGGIYARRYAQQYPEEVSGIVMLDPVHEGFRQAPKLKLRHIPRLLFNMIRLLLHYKPFFRQQFAQVLSTWPIPLRDRLIDYHLRSLLLSFRESRNLSSELYEEVVHGGDMPDVPLIVLTAMAIDPMQAVIMPKPFLNKTIEFKHNLYTVFAKSIPHGENRALHHAGHSWLHVDRQDAVIQAIMDVLRQSRSLSN